jgi:hypothetical protein
LGIGFLHVRLIAGLLHLVGRITLSGRILGAINQNITSSRSIDIMIVH